MTRGPRWDSLVDLIRSAQASDPFQPVTVVVPNPYARVHVRRAAGATAALCNVTFRTRREVLYDLARAGGAELRPAPPAVVREAVRGALLEAPSSFRHSARSARAVRELASTLDLLWRAPSSARTALRSAGPRGSALGDLAEDVAARLAGAGFADPATVLAAALAGVPRYRGPSLVLWCPRPGPAAEQEVVDALAGAGVVIGAVGPPDPAVGARVIACSDPDEEVRAVVRLLLASAGEGIPLWRQAVLHPPGDQYRRIVHQQLRAAGVPYSGPGLLTLDRTAAGHCLTGLLELAGGDWPRRALIRWLHSAPVLVPPDGVRAPADRWDDVSARAGVVAGLDQWRDRLTRFAEGGPARQPHLAGTPAESAAARRLAEFIDRLAAHVGVGPGRHWAEWCSWARSLLDRYLPRPDDDGWPPGEASALVAIHAVLDELAGLDAISSGVDLAGFRAAIGLELAGRVLPPEATPALGLPTDDVEEDDRQSLLADETAATASLGDGVFVASVADGRGFDFDVVHVVGLADGQFPGVVGDNGLLPPHVAAALEPAGWPTRAHRLEELRTDLTDALGTAARAVLTWARHDPRTGRAHVPCRWVEDMVRAGDALVEEQPSFTAGLAGRPAGGAAASLAERDLAELHRWLLAGGDLLAHPLATTDRGPRPSLGASLAAQSARSGPDFTRFDGNVGAALAASLTGVSGELSATRLELYATCPRRYLLDRELHLSAPFRPEETDRMEGRDRGTLVHAILEAYVRERINGAPPSLDRLLAIADEQFAAADAEARCGRPLVARVEHLLLRQELRRFFDEDRLDPVAVELRFGTGRSPAADGTVADPDGADPRPTVPAVSVEVGDGRFVSFGGSVDRIDRAPDGSVVVSDYKTGRQGGLLALQQDPVARGTKLQLPLYAMAARAYLGEDGPLRARYWLTSSGRAAPSFAGTVTEAVEQRMRQAVGLITEGIEAGAFPGVSGEPEWRPGVGNTHANCRYCDFDRLCPGDRDRQWSAVRSSVELAPVVALAEAEESSELANLVRPSPLDEGHGAR